MPETDEIKAGFGRTDITPEQVVRTHTHNYHSAVREHWQSEQDAGQ